MVGSPPLTVVMHQVIAFSLLVGAFTWGSVAPSSRSNDQLIFHTSDPKDCCPRQFQPTDEFQIVHDDQDLPAGLHVRISIQTGKKEAKVNFPSDSDSALAGLPVGQTSVGVYTGAGHGGPRIRKGAPAYDSIGKAKEPQQEFESFVSAMTMVRDGVFRPAHALDMSLDNLDDLSHDMYYGLKIAEDSRVLKALFFFMLGPEVSEGSHGLVRRDQRAASILAGTLSNNRPALGKVADTWPALVAEKCPKADTTLGQALFSRLIPAKGAGAADKQRAALLVKSKVAVINGLIKDDSIRAEFLDRGGMERLLEVLMVEGQQWAGAHRRVGELVLDTFLDEDMGAKLGQWPRRPRLSDEQCRSRELEATEGCWDYHVSGIMQANEGEQGHWSSDLHRKLLRARGTHQQQPPQQQQVTAQGALEQWRHVQT